MNNLQNKWKAVLWFIMALLVLFFADLLAKHFLFDETKMQVSTYENPVFGIRSYENNNSTIFSALDINIPFGYRVSFNLSLAVLFMIPIFFTKSIFQNISLAFVVAGILGNSVDIIFTNGHIVKDIIYTPWWDRGTFNLADLWIVIGALLFGISLIIKGFKPDHTLELIRMPS